MFGWLKGALSTPKAVDRIVKGGIDALDALVFTEEEKEHMSQKTYETWLEVQRVIASESTVRSRTRRYLACGVMGTFLGFLIFGGVIYHWNPKWSAYVLSLAKELGGLVLAISVFYFGVHVLRSLKEK